MDPTDGARGQRPAVTTAAPQEMAVEVVDVRGGELGNLQVAEMGNQVASITERVWRTVGAAHCGDATPNHHSVARQPSPPGSGRGRRR